MHHVNHIPCQVCAHPDDHERGCPRSDTFGTTLVVAPVDYAAVDFESRLRLAFEEGYITPDEMRALYAMRPTRIRRKRAAGFTARPVAA